MLATRRANPPDWLDIWINQLRYYILQLGDFAPNCQLAHRPSPYNPSLSVSQPVDSPKAAAKATTKGLNTYLMVGAVNGVVGVRRGEMVA